MRVDKIAEEVVSSLISKNQKVVLAESCTCGLVAATLGKISGVSEYLCGSAVTYRPNTKRIWLKVSNKIIKSKTTESHEVAQSMALGVLANTPEANWSLSVVGHIGPNAPKEKDGLIFGCIAKRTKKGRLKIKEIVEYKLSKKERHERQKEAVEAMLTYLAKTLLKSPKKQHV